MFGSTVAIPVPTPKNGTTTTTSMGDGVASKGAIIVTNATTTAQHNKQAAKLVWRHSVNVWLLVARQIFFCSNNNWHHHCLKFIKNKIIDNIYYYVQYIIDHNSRSKID